MSQELVVVFESQGPLGAEVALGRLRSEGITGMLRYEAVGRALGLTVDGLGLVQVLVALPDAARAREVLSAETPFDLPGGDDGPSFDEAGDSEEGA